MTSFFGSIQNCTYTENGALTYSTSGNANLDFFALAGACRNNIELAWELFQKAFEEDPVLAMKNLFYIRDIRDGVGERRVFSYCLQKLAETESNLVSQAIQHIPFYGYWKDIYQLYTIGDSENSINQAIKDLLAAQLSIDLKRASEGQKISLAAKWFPLPNNTRNTAKKALGNELVKALFVNQKGARCIISMLRDYIDVTERKMSSGKWSEIDYQKVPSKAMFFHRKAFQRNDEERFANYLSDVEQGKAKINASTLYPFEIVKSYLNSLDGHYDHIEKDMVLESLWEALPDYCSSNEVNTNAVVVVDTSDSMTDNNNIPLASAIGLGIYFSERNSSDAFKNRIITFSRTPTVCNFSCSKSLAEKIYRVFKADWGADTNLEAVFNLVLTRAKKYEVPAEEMPRTIFIISDMEFNIAINGDTETLFERMETLYAEAEYTRPNIVFWNVNARGMNLPVVSDENNTILISGHSPVVFKYIMEGTTPEEQMLTILNGDRYERLAFQF